MLDNDIRQFVSNMPEFVKYLNDTLEPSINWLDGGTYIISPIIGWDGVLSGYIEVEIGRDTPIESKMEIDFYSDKDINVKYYAGISYSGGVLSTSEGLSYETDVYVISKSKNASLHFQEFNSIGKVKEKITISNKPSQGHVPKISISIIIENDPLRQGEVLAIPAAISMPFALFGPIGGMSIGGIGYQVLK